MTYRSALQNSNYSESQQNQPMPPSSKEKSYANIAGSLLLAAITAFSPLVSTAQTSSYTQTNIVSDGSVDASKTDPNLINPWGIAIGKAFWIDSPGSGLSLVDDAQGNPQFTVTVPAASATAAHGMPTGVVFNADTTVFQIPNSAAAQFIFGTLDGTIAAWNSTTTQAITVVNNSATKAVYTGIAIDTNTTGTFLLAANQIPGGSIDVFDKNFSPTHLAGSFSDPSLPAGFSPFSVHVLQGNVYVAYTQVDPATGKRVLGAGLGFVDIFDANGNLVKRAISAGNLNAPWGVAIAPSGFGSFSGDLLVANFGDGVINAFDPNSFASKGSLQDAKGNVIVNSGLWEIVFGAKNVGDPNTLFFSAGINGTKGGLFGSIGVASPPVGNPDFALKSNVSSLTVKNGQAGTLSISLTPQNDFNTPASFSCSGLPSGDSCTLAPATVNLAGSSTTNVTVSISAASTAASASARSVHPPTGLTFAFICPLGMFAFFEVRQRSTILRGLSLALVLAFLSTAVIGCDSTSSKDQSVAPPAAPVTTNIMINAASGNIAHSIPIALTVN
ncbi:TIGR03118 family protein [Edaphobacter modestus]|uniref:Uncharacterized protein (TIGR03118 family) n=1 Tax=Edaphobacter modestus TaxID=388466 RepID=A0A4V6MFS7_9BACT|nr:TIGR03118 family protein [Edaphobacter modestus]RZU39146.1 uncharacterized protein (TIGR03118 family) [Edaphobacter modestus]